MIPARNLLEEVSKLVEGSASPMHAARGWLAGLAVAALLPACSGDPATLDGPTQAVRASDGHVYVADGYFNARIAVFGPDGAWVRDWGSKGFGPGQMQTPHGLVLTNDGVIVVADRDNGRVQRFTTQGTSLGVWQSEAIGRPWSVALGRDGAIFVADGGDQREDSPRAGIVELTPSGELVRRFGAFGSGIGQLDEPHMLAVSPSGAVYVAEIGNDRIQKFIPVDECDVAEPSCEYRALPDWPSLGATPGLAPLSIAVEDGRVLVGHQAEPASVWVLDEATGERVGVIGEGRFARPHGLSIDSERGVWVADDRGNRIVRLAPDGRVLLTIGAAQ
jgi:DNA-binding beta-propeller fold protein YncE